MNHKAGKLCNELEALPQHIGNGNVLWSGVVGVQGQHTGGQLVHHVLSRGVHDGIPQEFIRQGHETGQNLSELLIFSLSWQMPHDQ